MSLKLFVTGKCNECGIVLSSHSPRCFYLFHFMHALKRWICLCPIHTAHKWSVHIALHNHRHRHMSSLVSFFVQSCVLCCLSQEVDTLTLICWHAFRLYTSGRPKIGTVEREFFITSLIKGCNPDLILFLVHCFHACFTLNNLTWVHFLMGFTLLDMLA